MSKELAKVLIAALTEFVGEETKAAPAEKPKEEKSPRRSRRAEKAKEPSPMDELKEVAEKFKKLFSAKELKELLEDVAEVGSIAKVEEGDIPEVLEELKAEIEEADGEEESGDDDGEEITVEAVKIACQAFTKKEGKEEMGGIFEDYGIKSVRSLSKLSQEQLEDLYADVTDI